MTLNEQVLDYESEVEQMCMAKLQLYHVKQNNSNLTTGSSGDFPHAPSNAIITKHQQNMLLLYLAEVFIGSQIKALYLRKLPL
jgi:hypothetical protein